MDKDAIIELENYIFGHKDKPWVAASMMADCLGVMIGVKPAAICLFEVKEFAKINPDECSMIFERVGLKVLFFKHEFVIGAGELIMVEDVYISHSVETANKLHQAFTKLRSTLDDMGQVCDQKGWEEASIEIGRLLGYPETAIEYFVDEQDINNKERQRLMERYRFYAHSPKYHEQEYQKYDAKIYQALREYAPRASELLPEKK